MIKSHKCKIKGKYVHFDNRWGKCPWCGESVK